MRTSRNTNQGTAASEVVTPQPSERSQGAPKKAKTGSTSRATMKKNLKNYFGTPTGKATPGKGEGKGQDTTGKVSGRGTTQKGEEMEGTEGGFKVDFGSMNKKQRSKKRQEGQHSRQAQTGGGRYTEEKGSADEGESDGREGKEGASSAGAGVQDAQAQGVWVSPPG